MIKEPSSFRDPAAVLEFDTAYYYRKMSLNFLPHYLFFKESGLKDKLVKEGYILPFEEIIDEEPKLGFTNQILKTGKIPFVSYPYEWSFSQFKEAALLTLKINLIALNHGMILKDANMFNVQFFGCKPIFIDQASFEIYKQDEPWKAYYQFCRHFYAPLFLAAKKNIILPKLLQYFIDGIPLKEVVSLCSWSHFLNPGAFLHLYLHSRGEGKKVNVAIKRKLAKNQLVNILKHMEWSIENLTLKHKKTLWEDYNQDNNYEIQSKQNKTYIVKSFLAKIEGYKALDIGANDGLYSQLLAAKGMYTLVVDIDELAVERAFNSQYNLIHPLQMNLVNPTPAIGWNNTERKSFWERCQVDVIQALAIVHHLVITHDISFEEIAKKLVQHTKYLIIEFVAPEDSQAQILLRNKPHHRLGYNENNFENGFNLFFKLKEKHVVDMMNRTIYLYEKK
jgi:2-polyprenyl-3-methyl-5-hydroxy-6-metoxy-1,4-benzoquinol methylase